MIGSLIIPKGQVFIERPFECFFDKKTKQVTISGGKIVPIYSRQRSFRVENEGEPITLSSLQEVYLHLKTTPLTNEIEAARFVTDEQAKAIKGISDSALNMFLPICRYDENLDRIDDSFFNSNFNYLRQKGDKPLQGYYDYGFVYLNGFLLKDQISNSALGERAIGPKKIKAGEGDFIIARIAISFGTSNIMTSDITLFEIEKGTLDYPPVEITTNTEDDDEETEDKDQIVSLERSYPIGYVKDGNYVSLHTGNITVGVDVYTKSTTPYEKTVDETTTTEYEYIKSYSVKVS